MYEVVLKKEPGSRFCCHGNTKKMDRTELFWNCVVVTRQNYSSRNNTTSLDLWPLDREKLQKILKLRKITQTDGGVSWDRLFHEQTADRKSKSKSKVFSVCLWMTHLSQVMSLFTVCVVPNSRNVSAIKLHFTKCRNVVVKRGKLWQTVSTTSHFCLLLPHFSLCSFARVRCNRSLSEELW